MINVYINPGQTKIDSNGAYRCFLVSQQKTKKMARRRKEVVMPHLNNCGGDMKKNLYVEYSIRNPQSGEMERIRHYDGINQFSTWECFAAAQKIIEYYNRQITSGSISHQQVLEYEDLLLYDGQGSFTRKRTVLLGSRQSSVVSSYTYSMLSAMSESSSSKALMYRIVSFMLHGGASVALMSLMRARQHDRPRK
jgi:hypothetical protein